MAWSPQHGAKARRTQADEYAKRGRAHDIQRGARPDAADAAAFVQMSLFLSLVSGHALVSLLMMPLVQTVSRQLRRPVPWNARRTVEHMTSAPADMKYDNFLGRPQCTTKVNSCLTRKKQHNY